MSIRQLLAALSLAFTVTLAAVIGWRLTNEAMAVLVGVVAGALASVPASLIVVWVTMRHMRGVPREEPSRSPAPQSPPVIVVTAPAPAQMPAAAWPASLPIAAPAAERQFSVIGADDQ